MAPLQPQKTGAPPVRFGVKQEKPLVPQRTGRADLGRASKFILFYCREACADFVRSAAEPFRFLRCFDSIAITQRVKCCMRFGECACGDGVRRETDKEGFGTRMEEASRREDRCTTEAQFEVGYAPYWGTREGARLVGAKAGLYILCNSGDEDFVKFLR